MRIENIDEVMGKLKGKLSEYMTHLLGRDPGKSKFICPHPDHDDHNPSACLNHHEDFTEGKCFTCHANFDIFTMAHWNEGLPAEGPEFFEVTVRELADRFGITLVEAELTEAEKKLYGAYRALRRASEYVSSFDHGTWSESVLEYIEERDWTKQELHDQGIGVGDREGLINYMSDYGYSVEYLHQLGLVSIASGDGVPQIIDDGRLIFTLHNHVGRVVAFASRGFGGVGPKYLNSSASMDLYNKSELLYGLNVARKVKRKPLYLFEGYGDVVTARKAGLQNCAAVCGTALTVDQVLQAKQLGFQTIILAFDFDDAGEKATDRAVTNICDVVRDMGIKILQPNTEYNDPDEYIRANDIAKFILEETESTFSWTLRRKKDEGLGDEELANLMVSVIASEPNAISREVQLRELSDLTSVPFHAIEIEVLKKTDIRLDERRKRQNAVVKRLAMDIDNDPNAALMSTHEALLEFEKISQEVDADAVTNKSFITMIELQQKQEQVRLEEGTSIGFNLPLMKDFQTVLDGGDDWSFQNLWLLGGLENTGKSSFLAWMGSNIVSDELNDAMWICFTIDDTGQQILPKIVTSLDSIINRAYFPSDPLTIGNVRNPRTIQTPGLAKRRAAAYDVLEGLAADERIILKDAKEGNTLSYLENVVRHFRRRYPSRRIFITVDNTHNLGDFGHMDDRSERYKRLANVEKGMVNKYDAMMLATVEYKKVGLRENSDIRKMMPQNDDIAETRALKYLANFIGHLYNDIHSRPNIFDTFHVDPKTGQKLPRIMMNIGKTKFNDYKGAVSFDFFPGSSTFLPVSNTDVKLQRERFLKDRDDNEEMKDDKW